MQQLKKIQFEMKLHKTKASTFYERKRQVRKAAQISETIEAITMDFRKNLPLPNISTNDVYYRRQQSFQF
jgi:predicted Zn-dependent protease